jgi:DNA-binding MarR family transcriptional regulator
MGAAMTANSTKAWEDFVLDDSVPYLMIRVSGLMNRQLELDLRPLKVSFQHWRVLAVLAQKNGSSITDLSEYAVVPHSSLSRLLSRMEADGYVRRQMDTQDARSVRVYTTAVGEVMYRRILPMAVAVRERAMAGLSAAQKTSLLAALNHMLGSMQAPAKT